MKNKLFFLLGMTILPFVVMVGQEKENPLTKGVKFNFGEDGKSSMKIGFCSQLWARYTELNPNTLDWNGNNIDNHFDFLIRRNFLKVQASIDRFFFFSVFGLKSQTQMDAFAPFTNSNPQFFFYDIYSSYSFFDRQLYVGYGLHLYHGLSRHASASSVSTIGADVPMLGAPNVFTTEQLARNLGLFVDGLAGRLNYRFVLATPFITDSENMPGIDVNKAADIATTSLKTEGYLAWQFFDKEILPVPFTSGTYLGKKKIMNIGVGFKYHPNSTASLTESGDTTFHDQLHLAGDIFIDFPLGSKSAITLYGCYYLFDFGPNYLFSGGFGNTFRANSPQGAGNSEPLFGTGSAIATQLAWLLPLKVGGKGRVQAYYEGDYRFFEALDDNALHHNMGINYYILDNNFRITLQHEFRPYFESAKQQSYKSHFVFKVQVLI